MQYVVPRALLLGLLCIALAQVACSEGSDAPAQPSSAAMKDIAVYALSRGQGVPPGTQQIFQQIRSLLADEQARGLVVRLKEERIGLEGETRVCAVFRDGDAAAAAFGRMQALAAKTELLRVEYEACPQD